MIPSDSKHTHVLWIESDLYFPPEILEKLILHDVDIVAPMIYMGGNFYDQWAYRDEKDQPWSHAPPYHKDYSPFSLIKMGSVGSCVLFKRAVIDSGITFKKQGPFFGKK